MCPRRAIKIFFLLFCFFFFSRQIYIYIGEGDIWILRDTTFSANKTKTKTRYICERLGRGTLNTCPNINGLTLTKAVGIRTFVRLSAKITARHRIYLGLVYIRLWAVKLTYYWSYAVESSIVCAKLCTNMPRRTWKRLAQQGMGHFVSSYNKCLSIIDLFEGL